MANEDNGKNGNAASSGGNGAGGASSIGGGVSGDGGIGGGANGDSSSIGGGASSGKKPPFHSFSFTLIENKRPRASLRLAAAEGGMYELRVQKGSAANPSSQFTRQVPLDVAERLRDTLQRIGVFGWEESYGDAAAPGSRRWTVSTVFEEGVFSVESKGGSDVPPGFDALLEELYRLDFPRPAEPSIGAAPVIPTSIGDLAAFASKEGVPGLGDLSDLDPAALQQRMKEEFRHMSPDEQTQLIDTLVQMGAGTRDFWERFFRS